MFVYFFVFVQQKVVKLKGACAVVIVRGIEYASVIIVPQTPFKQFASCIKHCGTENSAGPEHKMQVSHDFASRLRKI